MTSGPLIKHQPKSRCTQPARGITLIVALLLLIVISLTAAVTVRTSSSAEQIANNTRSQSLAWEAAEAALRYCEVGAYNQHVAVTIPDLPLPTGFYSIAIAPAPASGASPLWVSPASWDGSPPLSTVVPLYKLDDPSSIAASGGNTRMGASFQSIYQRAPDCIAQYAGTSPPASKIIYVTARGFGPEVNNTDALPKGAEVFLQSTVDLNLMQEEK